MNAAQFINQKHFSTLDENVQISHYNFVIGDLTITLEDLHIHGDNEASVEAMDLSKQIVEPSSDIFTQILNSLPGNERLDDNEKHAITWICSQFVKTPC